MRVAGAPISWGVCEVPGWGHQMTPARVLAEMRGLGLTATEAGPDGFLPGDPGERDRLLGGLDLAGAFVPVVLHDPARDPLPEVDRALEAVAPGAMLVLAAATGEDGYDGRPELGPAGWETLLTHLGAVVGHAARRGHPAALHPHMATMVEGPEDVGRVLSGSTAALCLDTGHLLAAGADPAAVAREAADRIAHVHLKDVDAALAAAVRAGEIAYGDAVRAGMYRPLGEGDVDVAAIVGHLTGAGYTGWYVLEQDTVLDGEPPGGAGPAADVAASLAFLREVAA